jgi:hypothetical protein
MRNLFIVFQLWLDELFDGANKHLKVGKETIIFLIIRALSRGVFIKH